MNIQPPSFLLLGAPGSGKTDSLATLIEAGLELFVIITEPDGLTSLLDSCARRKLSIDKLHWATVIPAAAGWSAMNDMVNIIGTTGYEGIQNIKSGVGKAETRKPATKLLWTLGNFVDERTGNSYGDTTTWGPDRALVIDSTSGIALIAMDLTIGYKPAAHQGEWGVAMNFMEKLIIKMSGDRNCFFGMTAHIEKELNEINGVQQIMASVLGRKLAPKLPRFFSEVPLAKRTILNGVPSFVWSTVEIGADLKSRTLAVSASLPPTFVPVVKAYHERVKQAGSGTIPPATAAPETSRPAVAIPVAPMGRAFPAASAAGTSR